MRIAVSGSRSNLASPLRELRLRAMGSHPAEVTFDPPSPQPKLALDLATTEGCKAELIYVGLYLT